MATTPAGATEERGFEVELRWIIENRSAGGGVPSVAGSLGFGQFAASTLGFLDVQKILGAAGDLGSYLQRESEPKLSSVGCVI